MNSFKFLTYIIVSNLLSNCLLAQTLYDGPITLKIRVVHLWIDDYYDVFGTNQESRWKVWASDNGNYDGSGWVTGSSSCIEVNDPGYQ